jgi:hypothetical protein
MRRECLIVLLYLSLTLPQRGERKEGYHRLGEIDWAEVKRLSLRREYDNFQTVKSLVNEVAQAIGQRSPYDSHE